MIQMQDLNFQIPLNNAHELTPVSFSGGPLPIGGYEIDVNELSFARKKGRENDPSAPIVACFDVTVTEKAYAGIQKSIYASVPAPVPPSQDTNSKEYRAWNFQRRNWLTILLSLGYTEQQIGQNFAITGQAIQNAPGRGRAYMFIDHEEQAVNDKITNVPVIDPTTGHPLQRTSENRNFCTPSTYQQRRMGTAGADRAPAAPATTPAGLPGQPQVQTYAPPAPGAVPGGYSQVAPQGVPGMVTPPMQPFAGAPAPMGGAPGFPAPNGAAPMAQPGAAPSLIATLGMRPNA